MTLSNVNSSLDSSQYPTSLVWRTDVPPVKYHFFLRDNDDYLGDSRQEPP